VAKQTLTAKQRRFLEYLRDDKDACTITKAKQYGQVTLKELTEWLKPGHPVRKAIDSYNEETYLAYRSTLYRAAEKSMQVLCDIVEWSHDSNKQDKMDVAKYVTKYFADYKQQELAERLAAIEETVNKIADKLA
jgi:hypothetical protein